MTKDGWHRVGPALQQRMQDRGVSKSRLVREGHVDWSTVDKLLTGKPVTRETALWRIAAYLGWPNDAFDAIRRGETPSELAAIQASPERSELSILLESNAHGSSAGHSLGVNRRDQPTGPTRPSHGWRIGQTNHLALQTRHHV